MEIGPFYSREELLAFGFTKVGSPTWVSRKSSFYAIHGSIGDHVRVDDFCILKGHLEIGSYVHIAAFCSLSGVAGVVAMGNCSSIGNRVSIFTGSDDFRANSLNSNLVPQEMVSTISGDVRIGIAAMVSAHSVILPGVSVGDAAAVGAQCLLSHSIEAGTVLVSGAARCIPVGKRDVAKILELAAKVMPNSGPGALSEKA
jgi:acetyltransferase-like isoleucine patch superfamily enzyme